MPATDVIAPAFVPSRELFPFRSRWYDSPHGNIHYVDEGKGPALLLLHGNPTWSFLYRGVILQLRDRFRCVAPDYPGFGLSERPPGYGYTPPEHAHAVGHLVDTLGLEDFVVVGHDWGGPIGIALALERRARVRGFVMGNTWCWPLDRLVNRVFGRVMSSYWLHRATIERNMIVERLIPAGTARRLAPEELEHYRRVQPTPGARLGVASLPYHLLAATPWLAAIDAQVGERLGEKPLLLTWGMRDRLFSPGHFIPRWRRRFRDSVVVELHRARHFIQEDAPTEVAEAIAARFAG